MRTQRRRRPAKKKEKPDESAPGFRRCSGQHAAAAPQRAEPANRLRDPRQGRIHEPGRIGERPRGALDAEARGALKPGGTVVEGTAGNTGIGIAHVCNARGYRCVIVMPDNQSPEKYRLIEALGAEVRKVPTVPYSNPAQYQHQAGRL